MNDIIGPENKRNQLLSRVASALETIFLRTVKFRHDF